MKPFITCKCDAVVCTANFAVATSPLSASAGTVANIAIAPSLVSCSMGTELGVWIFQPACKAAKRLHDYVIISMLPKAIDMGLGPAAPVHY